MSEKDKAPIEKLRAELRAKHSKPWTQPDVWARDRSLGLWHIAVRTYTGAADTACGVNIRADLFQTERPTFESQRPEFCLSCEGHSADCESRQPGGFCTCEES